MANTEVFTHSWISLNQTMTPLTAGEVDPKAEAISKAHDGLLTAVSLMRLHTLSLFFSVADHLLLITVLLTAAPLKYLEIGHSFTSHCLKHLQYSYLHHKCSQSLAICFCTLKPSIYYASQRTEIIITDIHIFSMLDQLCGMS